MRLSTPLFLLALVAGTACTDDTCEIQPQGDGTTRIVCGDETATVFGEPEADTTCTVADNGDGTSTITCDDGTSTQVGTPQLVSLRTELAPGSSTTLDHGFGSAGIEASVVHGADRYDLDDAWRVLNARAAPS